MNWAGLSIALGLAALGIYTMPWGLLIFAVLGWLVWSSTGRR